MQYIVTPSIMEVYMEADHRAGSRVSKQWWEQGGINFFGLRSAVAAETEEQWKVND